MREGIDIPLIFFLAVVGCLMVATTAYVVEGYYNFTVMEFEAQRLEAATWDKVNRTAYENQTRQLASLTDDAGPTIDDAIARIAAEPEAVVDPRTAAR
jgi:hypothetical protein